VLLHVQTTEPKILREYILQEGNKLEVKPPMAVTNAVSWRTEGIKYRKNEIFLDVIERCRAAIAKVSSNPTDNSHAIFHTSHGEQS